MIFSLFLLILAKYTLPIMVIIASITGVITLIAISVILSPLQTR
jgi:hypothetical protein